MTRRFRILTAAFLAAFAGQAQALSVEDAILFVLETHPEIQAAEANKQAIEFELDQSRDFFMPRVELEGRAGFSLNDGTTTPDLSSADDALPGYEVRALVTQRIFDGYETRSEIARQAYRVDGAALRVLERSEFLGLEAIRTYANVLRDRRLVALAEENLAYHRETVGRIESAFENGVLGIGDLQQAEERLLLAEDFLTRAVLDLSDASLAFVETVGVAAEGLGSIPSVSRALPASSDQALRTARARNPTLRFSQADVGAAEALYRRSQSTAYPSLSAELDGRYGEDTNGYEGRTSDLRAQLVLRYEFQGRINSADREEQLRRVGESRARLLSQARLVDREVLQTWERLATTRQRVDLLARQTEISAELLATYETEFEVGTRSLLDLLNTQNALYQAKANLVASQAIVEFDQFRLLAAMGVLLTTLGIEPPPDAIAYGAEKVGAPGVRAAEDQQRRDAIIIDAARFRKSLDR